MSYVQSATTTTTTTTTTTRNRTHNGITVSTSHNSPNSPNSSSNSSSDSTASEHRQGKSSQQPHTTYFRRWIMLLLISLLNLISDWTCFSVAPVATLTSSSLPFLKPTLLIVVFLFSNGISTYFEPCILSLFGLRRTIVLGAILLMIGNLIKCASIQTMRVYIGFFLVGLSQPLYQCTPALLSSSWFPDHERTLATGVALNSNQLGIGCAFFFGTFFVETVDDLLTYFNFLGGISTLLCLCVLLWFENAPPSPPSDTARVLKGSFQWNTALNPSDDDSSHFTTTPNFATPLDFFLSPTPSYTARSLYETSSVVTVSFSQISAAYSLPTDSVIPKETPLHRRNGFPHALVAFTISSIVINTTSASLDYLLSQTNVGFIGALFQLLIMVSSLSFGRFTDVSRAYHSVILSLLLLGAFSMAFCGLGFNVTTSLLFVAIFVGPVMPISTEMGVEISYPLCANAVLVLFQFVANISSALFLPIFEGLRNFGNKEYQRSWEALILVHAISVVYFSTFRGKYKRLEIEKFGNNFGEDEPLLKKNRII